MLTVVQNINFQIKLGLATDSNQLADFFFQIHILYDNLK